MWYTWMRDGISRQALERGCEGTSECPQEVKPVKTGVIKLRRGTVSRGTQAKKAA